MEGKLLDFLVDTEAQHSVLLKAEGLLTSKRSWGGGGRTGTKQYFHGLPKTSGLRDGTGNQFIHGHSLVPLPLTGEGSPGKNECPISFKPGEVWLLDQKGYQIQVLTLNLASETEYKLYKSPTVPE
jgi:hypothetical protein